MNKTAEQLLVEIIMAEIDLTENQVWVRNQTRTVPPGSGLYVVVGMTDSRPVSAQSYIESKPTRTPRLEAETFSFVTTESGGLLACETGEVYEEVEIQRVQTMDAIQIDIFSRDNSALTRRWEVIGALRSIAAQQTQEENFFKICRLPASFLNISAAEGGSNLNRFSLTFNCFVWFQKERVLSSGGVYDDFKTRVDDAVTIAEDRGLIEFEIASDDAVGRRLLQETGRLLLTEDNSILCLTVPIYNGP